MIRKHVLRTVMVPVVTVIGVSFGPVFSGSIAIETVHGRPGIGRLIAQAILGRDIFSRLGFGARLSLGIDFAVVLATGLIGTAIGLAAGCLRRLEAWLVRGMDALMAFPVVMRALAVPLPVEAGPSHAASRPCSEAA